MITIRPKKSIKEWFLLAMFYLLVFQSPLEGVFAPFKYIDELFPFIGLIGVFYIAIRNGKVTMKKNTAQIVILLTVFFVSGILGNVIYQYQPIKSVLIDLYTNFKFFFSILSGYVLFTVCNSEVEREALLRHAKMIATVMFVLLILDLVFHIYPSPEERYGIRVVQLFYYHCTYLAAAMVFLLAIFMAFYEENNKMYMLFALAVLFFTLRGKAMAGAAVFVLIFYFIVLKKKKLRFYHMLLMAAIVFVIGKDLFAFYYLDLEGASARSVLTQTSFQIMKDYFPIGTGFGTFASAEAGIHYSPVYEMYGFRFIYELDGSGSDFFSDTFWPIIMGQSGAIGTICFASVLVLLFLKVLRSKNHDIRAYGMGVFVIIYIVVSSTSEPAFHNSIAIPLAMMLGYIFTLEKQYVKETERHRNRHLSV